MILDWWCAELTGDHGHIPDLTLEEHLRELYVVPTQMMPCGGVLITYADDDDDRGDTTRHEYTDVLFAHEKFNDNHSNW